MVLKIIKNLTECVNKDNAINIHLGWRSGHQQDDRMESPSLCSPIEMLVSQDHMDQRIFMKSPESI